MIDDVQSWIDNSEYDNWEWYFLILAAGMSTGIYFEVQSVTSLLQSLDSTTVVSDYTFSGILIASLQGIVMGMIGKRLYTQGDTYSTFVTDNFATKETTFLARIGVMTCISIFVGLVLPDVVGQYAEYTAVQVGGTVIVAGYMLIHSEIRNWNLMNEAPVLAAGGLLVVAPMLG